MPNPKQASSLWCPMVRVAQHGSVSVNRIATLPDGHDMPQLVCLADRCAMWRWNEPRTKQRTMPAPNAEALTKKEAGNPGRRYSQWEFIPYDADEGAPAHWLQPENEAIDERQGFCGLAGRPEIAA